MVKIPFIIEKYSGYVIFRLKASLHSAEIVQLRKDVLKSSRQANWVVFDLAEIKYLYSAALGFIVFINKQLQEKGSELCLININENLALQFDSVGFPNLVKAFPNEKIFIQEAKLG